MIKQNNTFCDYYWNTSAYKKNHLAHCQVSILWKINQKEITIRAKQWFFVAAAETPIAAVKMNTIANKMQALKTAMFISSIVKKWLFIERFPKMIRPTLNS